MDEKEKEKDIEKVDATKKDSSLPKVSLQYFKKGKSPNDEVDRRISNVLLENMTATPKYLEQKYGITLTDKIVKQAVDENGNITRLTALQKAVQLSLANQISLLSDTPEIQTYLESLKKGIEPQNIKAFIRLEFICQDLFGKEEKWKTNQQKKVREALEAISKKKQLHIYKAVVKDENGEIRNLQVKDFFPYINITGRETQVKTEKRTAVAVEIEFSRIFFERLWDRYFLVQPSYLENAVGSNGRRIVTQDHFTSLFNIVAKNSWTHYYKNLPEAENYIKKEGILDPYRIDAIKKKALTHPPISFSELIDTLAKKPTKHREEKRRFLFHLGEAMWALINMGILSEDSRIDKDNETINLVYSENPEASQGKQPSGYWTKNPFQYKKK